MAKAKSGTTPTARKAATTAPAMGGPAPEVGSSAAAPPVPPAAQKTPRAAKPKAAAAVAPQQAQQPQIVITATHDQIAKRAYEIWLAKGRPAGRDHENWREAETQLRSAVR